MAVTIPDGYAAYGWHSFPGGNLWKGSKVHLVPAERLHHVAGGTRQRVYGPALCGRSMRGRGSKPDDPRYVVEELNRGEREPCTTCFAKAAA
jgi:hypothetical protein